MLAKFARGKNIPPEFTTQELCVPVKPPGVRMMMLPLETCGRWEEEGRAVSGRTAQLFAKRSRPWAISEKSTN